MASIGERATVGQLAARVGQDLVLEGDDHGGHKVAIKTDKLIHRSAGTACDLIHMRFEKDDGSWSTSFFTNAYNI